MKNLKKILAMAVTLTMLPISMPETFATSVSENEYLFTEDFEGYAVGKLSKSNGAVVDANGKVIPEFTYATVGTDYMEIAQDSTGNKYLKIHTARTTASEPSNRTNARFEFAEKYTGGVKEVAFDFLPEAHASSFKALGSLVTNNDSWWSSQLFAVQTQGDSVVSKLNNPLFGWTSEAATSAYGGKFGKVTQTVNFESAENNYKLIMQYGSKTKTATKTLTTQGKEIRGVVWDMCKLYENGKSELIDGYAVYSIDNVTVKDLKLKLENTSVENNGKISADEDFVLTFNESVSNADVQIKKNGVIMNSSEYAVTITDANVSVKPVTGWEDGAEYEVSVSEVSAVSGITPWSGEIFKLTGFDCLFIEDFEDYELGVIAEGPAGTVNTTRNPGKLNYSLLEGDKLEIVEKDGSKVLKLTVGNTYTSNDGNGGSRVIFDFDKHYKNGAYEVGFDYYIENHSTWFSGFGNLYDDSLNSAWVHNSYYSPIRRISNHNYNLVDGWKSTGSKVSEISPLSSGDGIWKKQIYRMDYTLTPKPMAVETIIGDKKSYWSTEVTGTHGHTTTKAISALSWTVMDSYYGMEGDDKGAGVYYFDNIAVKNLQLKFVDTNISDNAKNIRLDKEIVFEFNNKIGNADNLKVTGNGKELVKEQDYSVTIDDRFIKVSPPEGGWDYDSEYVVETGLVSGSSDAVRKADGKVMTFTTGSENMAVYEIHISPDGNDGNDGSAENPVKTFEKARDIYRELANTDEMFSGEILVHGGVYRLTKSLEFDERDNGLKIKAYGDGEVLVKGSKELEKDGFSVTDDNEFLEKLPEQAKGKVVEYDLSGILETVDAHPEYKALSGGTAYYELYVGDTLQTIARWPNYGFALTGATDGLTFKSDSQRLEKWQNSKYAMVRGYWSNNWAIEHSYIGEVDVKNSTVTLAKALNYGSEISKGMRYYALNMPEEMDIPGEYYIDCDAKKLYYYPGEGFDDEKIELSTLKETLFNMNGASDVEINGITFEQTRTSAIKATNGDNVIIDSCTIRNIGNYGISLNTKNSEVKNCEIYNVGGAGINVSSGNRTKLIKGNTKVTNNHIYNFGRIFRTYQAALIIDGVGNEAKYNTIHDSPHMGVSVKGNDNVISNNEIYNIVFECSDSGAIYTGRSWEYWGNVISDNYIHDIRREESFDSYTVSAIYLDDMMSGITVKNNVIENSERGALLGGGRANVFTDNIIVNCDEGLYYDDRAVTGEWAHKSVIEGGPVYDSVIEFLGEIDVEVWKEKYPGFAEMVADIESYQADNTHETGYPEDSVVTGNVFYGSATKNNTYNDISEYVYSYGTVSGNTASTTVGEYEIPEVGADNFAWNGEFEVYSPAENATINSGDIEFVWSRPGGVDRFKVVITDSDGKTVFEKETNYDGCTATLSKKGIYNWKVTATSKDESVVKEGSFEFKNSYVNDILSDNMESITITFNKDISRFTVSKSYIKVYEDGKSVDYSVSRVSDTEIQIKLTNKMNGGSVYSVKLEGLYSGFTKLENFEYDYLCQKIFEITETENEQIELNIRTNIKGVVGIKAKKDSDGRLTECEFFEADGKIIYEKEEGLEIYFWESIESMKPVCQKKIF